MILRSTFSSRLARSRAQLVSCLLALSGSSSGALADDLDEAAQPLTRLEAIEADASEANCDEVYLLKPHVPFVAPVGTEKSPTFRFSVPWGDEPRQLIGVAPVLNNKRILGNFRILGASDIESELLYAWRPGDDPLRMPADVGLWLPSGTGAQLWLQPTYRNPGSARDELDDTGARLCVVKGTHLRKHVAGVTNLFSARDPDGIPAQSGGHRVSGVCTVTAEEPVSLVTVAMTMRIRGISATSTLTPREGTPVALYDQKFDFSSQQTKLLTQPVVLASGDRVETSCLFRNSSDVPLAFGDKLSEETCVNYATYYPRGALHCAP